LTVLNDSTFSQTSVAESPVFSFGPFTLDDGRGVLMCDDVEIPLRPKAYDVLIYLLTHQGRIVSREELMGAVWPDVVVTDDSLTQCLIDIRKALKDDQHLCVRTVPRRGYLFDVAVKTTVPRETASRSRNLAHWRRPSYWTLVFMSALTVAVGATWWHLGGKLERSIEDKTIALPAGEVSIAVLPFVDLSEEGGNEFLAEGISEEILNLLSQIPEMNVIARTSSFSFRDQNLEIGVIARHLNATHLLEGSVRTSGDRVRVTAQLIDGASGLHLWSQGYDDRLDDTLALQSTIASEVTEVLASTLLDSGELEFAQEHSASGDSKPQGRSL